MRTCALSSSKGLPHFLSPLSNFINISFNSYTSLFSYSAPYNAQVYLFLDYATDHQACFQLLCGGLDFAFILLSFTYSYSNVGCLDTYASYEFVYFTQCVQCSFIF